MRNLIRMLRGKPVQLSPIPRPRARGEFTRFGTTGRTQLEEVVAALRASGLAAAPERVFGI